MILFEYGTGKSVIAASLTEAIDEFNLKYGTNLRYTDTYSVDGEYTTQLNVGDFGYSVDEENESALFSDD